MSRTTNKVFPEVRERAVRMVLDHEGQHGSRWSAIVSIPSKIGCAPRRRTGGSRSPGSRAGAAPVSRSRWRSV
jgi:aminopeptidase C